MNHQQQGLPRQHQDGRGGQAHQQPQPPHMRGGPVIRPSPIPANAPTEHDILAEMNMRQHAAGGLPDAAPGQGGSSGVPGYQVPHPGIRPAPEDVLMMAAQRRLMPELLKTQEAISLQTAVQNQGISMLNTLLYQFVYGQMDNNRREILLQVSFKSVSLLRISLIMKGPRPVEKLRKDLIWRSLL